MAVTLPYDINDSYQRKELEGKIIKWIETDRIVHQRYHAEWNDADDRLNDDRVPMGFTTDHSSVLATANDPTQIKQKVMEYVPVNRTRSNHESLMGDFASIIRKLTIQGTQPRFRNIAKVYQARIRYIENIEQFAEKILFVAMDNSWAKGLHWIDITYNPKANNLRGKFDIKDYNCRDVMVDAMCRGAYFERARRFTIMAQFDKEQAEKEFQNFPLYDTNRFSPDQDYNIPYKRSEGSMYEDMATFYRVQFAEPVQTYYVGDPKTTDIREISEQEYNELQKDGVLAQFTFMGEKEDRWFNAFYSTGNGLFHLEENILGRPTTVPLGNIYTDSRLYPIGDIKIYSQLQDLLDTLVTVFLENAKKANKPVIPVDPEVMEEYQGELENAVAHGGVAPGARGVFYAQSINQALTQLIPWTLGWIQDSVARHSASMGELPAKQVAKETVQALISKDRQSHGRKDVMLKYSLTAIAKLLVRMIQLCDETPDMFLAIDPKPHGFTHIPINQRWTEQEYLSQLAALANMKPPSNELELPMFFEQLKQVRAKFEEENDIQIQLVDGFSVTDPSNGAIFEVTPEKLREAINKSGYSDEDFFALSKPEPIKVKMYIINDLTQDVDLKVEYGVDDDYENDKQFKANRAMLLNSRGSMSRLDMLREMGIANAEELVANADAENQALQLAKALAANPDAMQAAIMMLQGVGKGKEGKPEPKQITQGQEA